MVEKKDRLPADNPKGNSRKDQDMADAISHDLSNSPATFEASHQGSVGRKIEDGTHFGDRVSIALYDHPWGSYPWERNGRPFMSTTRRRLARKHRGKLFWIK